MYSIRKLFLSVIFLSLIPGISFSIENAYDYPGDLIYSSAYRFVLLKKNFAVTKDNPEMGLIGFTYAEEDISDKSSSIEIINDSIGASKSKLRLNIPAISDSTVRVLMDQLNLKIKSDYAPQGLEDEIFFYPLEKLFPSIYRYLVVDKKFEVIKSDKEKGIIIFIPREEGLNPEKSFLEIIKMPSGSFKVKMTAPSLASSSIRSYLNGISLKLKSDYKKEN